MTEKQQQEYVTPGRLYFADNGRLICSKCAGMSARYTGRDISGQRIQVLGAADILECSTYMGRRVVCECGGTIIRVMERQ